MIDNNGMTNTFNPTFTITNRIASGLTRIERARGFLEATTLSEDWLQEMGRRALVSEAHHTTHIEGAQLTLDQSEQLLAGKLVPEADPEDTKELLNYRQAFAFVSEHLASGDPITEGFIREIHKRLVEGVRGGAALPGEYRKTQNYVVNSLTDEIIYTPPPPHDVPPMMTDLVDWLKQAHEVHPVLVSGISQFQLVHVHPFRDGNGRTSRLLSTLCLYRAGYDFKRLCAISEFYDRDRPAFYKAIQSVRKANMDMTGWLEFFVDGLSIQLAEVKERGEQAIRKDVIAKRYALSDRQALAVAHILAHGRVSIQDFARLSSGVNRRTLQRDLKAMVDKDLITEKAANPTDPAKTYVPTSKLSG